MSNLSLQICFLGKCLIFSIRVRWFCTQCSFGIVYLTPLLEKTHILFPPMPKWDKTSSAFNTLRINRTALLLPGFYQGEVLAGQLGHSDTQWSLSSSHVGKWCIFTLYPYSSWLTSRKQVCGPDVGTWGQLYICLACFILWWTKSMLKMPQAWAAYCNIVNKNPYIFGVMMYLPRFIKLYLIFYFPCHSLMCMPGIKNLKEIE